MSHMLSTAQSRARKWPTAVITYQKISMAVNALCYSSPNLPWRTLWRRSTHHRSSSTVITAGPRRPLLQLALTVLISQNRYDFTQKHSLILLASGSHSHRIVLQIEIMQNAPGNPPDTTPLGWLYNKERCGSTLIYEKDHWLMNIKSPPLNTRLKLGVFEITPFTAPEIQRGHQNLCISDL